MHIQYVGTETVLYFKYEKIFNTYVLCGVSRSKCQTCMRCTLDMTTCLLRFSHLNVTPNFTLCEHVCKVRNLVYE